jgi:diguanylate cyclase (GGDEF)-like protein
MGLFLLDIDHFKEVNDTYGHEAGDKLLIAVARSITGQVLFDDSVIRWGGKEFLILLPHTKVETLSQISLKLLQTIPERTLKNIQQ